MAKKKENDLDICKTFKDWFAENSHRFHQPCRIRHYKSGGRQRVHIYFDNIGPKIQSWVSEGLVLEVAAYHKGKIMDFMFCGLECPVRQNKNKKYYCGFCLKPKYYKTPEELVIEHSFEEFLKIANKMFNNNHVLKIEYGSGWSGGKVISKKELLKISIEEQTDSNTVLILPIIEGDGDPVMYGSPLTEMTKELRNDYKKRK
ncbi:MAG: hypothetical protein GX556_04000 [Fibrobacter sp.]|nr:hypothetical protein [Fibrobacter sp.]